MVHVQEADLALILLEDHDEGVHKLVSLRQAKEKVDARS